MMLNTSKKRGFTLVELMITLAILAIAATIAVPSFTRFIRNNQVQAQASEMVQLIQYTRSQAVIQRRTKSISMGDTIWQALSGEQGERTLIPKADIGFNATVTDIEFNAMGSIPSLAEGVAEVTIDICHTVDSSIGYRVSISRSGSIQNNRLTTCSL